MQSPISLSFQLILYENCALPFISTISHPEQKQIARVDSLMSIERENVHSFSQAFMN